MTIAFDEEGFLRDLSAWSTELITVVRDFYHQYQLSPAMRPLVKAVTLALGNDKGKSIYLMKLFPGSPAKLIAKIGGLPKPDNCL